MNFSDLAAGTRRPGATLSFALLLAGAVGPHATQASHAESTPAPASRASTSDTYGTLPLSFEANRGQTDGRVKFLSRGPGYALFLTSTEAVLALRSSETVLRMQLVGANPVAHVAGHDELPGKSNYFIGPDTRGWRTQVSTYSQVEYQNVYPGVNLVYYGNQRQLEYDFLVAPGADLKAIELAFDGAQTISIDGGGDLVLRAGADEIRFQRPVIYQHINGGRQEIRGGYAMKDDRRVGFRVDAYDEAKPLIIDPVLEYSTYLGGSGWDDSAGIAVDAAGSAYVTGVTFSTDFPTTDALPPAAGANVFVAKLNATGSALEYATYIGGHRNDYSSGIAVDGAGNAYITGTTFSHDFPLSPDAFQADKRGLTDAFAVRLDATGSMLLYSTYLGGNGNDDGSDIAIDDSGNSFIVGTTSSTDFPTVNPFQAVNPAGNPVAFVTKLNAGGTSLIYSTYLGGSIGDFGYDVAVDTAGNAYVTGVTASADFPTFNALQPVFAGVNDAFLSKLSSTGSALMYSTYLGGAYGDTGSSIAVDAGGNVYVAGLTTSPDFPVTADAFDIRCGTDGTCNWDGAEGYLKEDAFVTKLDHTDSLVYSTYIGGSGGDSGAAIAVDGFGNAYVTGFTDSADFPTTNAVQTAYTGGDAFVTKLHPTGSGLVYSTFLGGDNSVAGDWGAAVSLDQNRDAYVAGFTGSESFPTTPNPLQWRNNGSGDGFVAKISGIGAGGLSITKTGSPHSVSIGEHVTYTVRVFNAGPDAAWDVVLIDDLPAEVSLVDFSCGGAWPVVPQTDGRTVSCSFATLDDGGTGWAEITVSTTAAGTIVNTASVTSSPSGESETATATTIVAGVEPTADLSIVEVDGTPDGEVGELLGYRFAITNNGPVDAFNPTLIDTLPETVVIDSAVVSAPSPAAGCAVEAGAVVCNLVWLPAGSTAEVGILVKPTVAGLLSSTATVSSDQPDPNHDNNTATSTTTIITRVNTPPIADAGPDQIVSAGADCRAMVTLNGLGSSDPNGDALTYTWTIVDPILPPIVLSGEAGGVATGPTPSGPLPPGTYTIMLTVDDGNGGTMSDTVVVTVRDVSAPIFADVPLSLTVEQSGPLTSVVVPMPTASDNCSGSAPVSSDAPPIFPPGITTVTFTASDPSGNSATASTTVAVVDSTPPTLGIVAPQARDYVHLDVLTLSFSAADAGSGVATGAVSATVDGSAVAHGEAIDLLTLPLGAHTFMLSAADAAGNSIQQSVGFRIIATLDSLIGAVNALAARGKITAPVQRNLLTKLSEVRQALDRGNLTVARNKLNDVIATVHAQSGKGIAVDAASLLVSDAEYVLTTL